MLGAKQMNQLLRHAERQDARVILVGDVKQIASIESGRAFGQLQQAGMATSVLNHIVRQRNYDLKRSVELAAQGKMKNALERVQEAGGLYESFSDDKYEAMIRMAATKYRLMSDKQRQNCLVIATSRAARDSLNEQIRSGLKAQKVLSGQEVGLESLSPVGWTKAEMRHVANYIQSQNATVQVDGDLVVRFAREYQSLGVQKGEYGRVVGGEDDKVKLQMQDGREILWNPSRQA
jgi:ATP-dependent exoDNAse (exonuclease V) alpha subunit